MTSQILERPPADAAPGHRASIPALARGARRQWPWILLTAGVALLVLLPLVPLQGRALSNGADGLRQLTALPGLGAVVRNTILMGLGALAVGMVLGTVLAFCVYAMPPRLRRYLAFTPVLPMVIPSVAHVVGFVFLFSPENGYVNTLLRGTGLFSGGSGPINVYTSFWIIVYTGVHLAAFVFLFVYSGLRNLGTEYELAARVNGAGSIRSLVTITLPLLRPTFVYAGAVVLLLALGQFTGPLILGRREGLDVLTTRMYELTLDYPVNYSLAAAFGTPLIVVAVLLIVAQRKMIGNVNRFVGQGAATVDARVPGRVTTFVSVTIVGVFVLVSAIMPLLALAFVSLSPFWSGKLSLSALTFENYPDTLNSPAIVDSVVTSLTVSVLAVVIVLPLGMLIALGIQNRDRLWRPLPTILDVAANLPLSIPAALVGFGFLFALSGPPLQIYGTSASFVLGYVTIMIPYATRYQLATLVALGRQTFDASRVSGGGPVRTFFRIILPLSRSGIASSAAIMFVLLIHEFGVSLLLRSPTVNVLSVALFDQYDGGSYPQVAVIAIVMTAITAAGVAAAMLFGGSRALERL